MLGVEVEPSCIFLLNIQDIDVLEVVTYVRSISSPRAPSARLLHVSVGIEIFSGTNIE
jgi:hypothetical protein